MLGISLYKWKLSYRLIIPTSTLLLIIFLTLYIFTNYTIGNNLKKTSEESLKAQVDTAWHIINESRLSALEKLNSDLKVFNYMFYNTWGRLEVTGKKIEMNVFNPLTGAKEKVLIPQWNMRNSSIQNKFDKVDQVKALVGGTATIYQRTKNGFLRIATNVKDKNDTRVVGTYLPNESLAVQEILKGKTYKGRDFLVDDWYLTAYEPIRINGEIQGILSVGVNEKNIQKIKTALKAITFGESGHFFVMDLHGNMIIHKTKEGQNVADEDYAQSMISLKESVGEEYIDGSNQITAYKYYQDFNWILVSAVESEEFITKIQEDLKITTAYSFVIAIIILSLALYFASRTVTVPVNQVLTRLRDIAEGEGDLTKRLQVRGEAEVGELAKWFNRFVENIQSVIQDIGMNSSVLAASTDELTKSSGSMKRNSSEVSNSEASTSASITQSSQTIHEMSTSLQQTAKKMQELQVITTGTEKDGSMGIDVINRTYKAMDKIEISSRHIDGIVGVITDIANQIDLLSLNAAIEAAHAGEFGKGFAIVAEQVSNLANRSNNAVVEIRKLISEGNLSIIEGKRVIEQTGQVLENIVEQVQDITHNVKEVATTITEHDIGIRELAKGSEDISYASDKNALRLEDLSKSIDENNSTISRIKDIADQLESQVSRFKV